MPIDILVGENIRICRVQRRLTQTELGQRIGVSFNKCKDTKMAPTALVPVGSLRWRMRLRFLYCRRIVSG